MIYRFIIYALVSLVSYYASLKYAYNFKYEDYKDYLNLISGVSGMVFTIMGIWIAFLYPNAISRIVNPNTLIAKDFSESRLDAKRLESIVGAIMISALIMMLVLLIALAKLIILMFPIYIEYKLQLKSAALSMLIFITLAQLESVIKVVFSNVMFINDLHFKRQSRQSDEEL